MQLRKHTQTEHTNGNATDVAEYSMTKGISTMEDNLGKRVLRIAFRCPVCGVTAMDCNGHGNAIPVPGNTTDGSLAGPFHIYSCEHCSALIYLFYGGLQVYGEEVHIQGHMWTTGNVDEKPVEVKVIWHLQGTEDVSVMTKR